MYLFWNKPKDTKQQIELFGIAWARTALVAAMLSLLSPIGDLALGYLHPTLKVVATTLEGPHGSILCVQDAIDLPY